MAEEALPQLPSRALVSRYFGNYRGSCLCSPVWYVVGLLFLELLPMGVNVAQLSALKTEQFGANAYWIVNVSMVLQSLLNLPAIALCGSLSQPHRLGRKPVLVALTCLSTITVVMPAVTSNAYLIVAVETLMSCFACNSMSKAMFPVVLAWTTDWCTPEQKMTYFSIIMGCMFGTFSLGPLVPLALQVHTATGIFTLAALMKLASPVFTVLIFPRQVPSLDPLTPASLARRYSASPRFSNESQQAESCQNAPPGRETGCNLSKSMKHIYSSVTYLFRTHASATLVYLMINFCDTAVQDSIQVYLIKEKGFSTADLGALITVMGMSGFVGQCILMPVANALRIQPRPILAVAVFAMVVHFCCYAFLTDTLAILITTPIGGAGYIAVIASTTIISGASTEDELPRDQGTLLGTLNGLETLASVVGPLLLAGCSTNWRSFPPPLDCPGIGFAILALIMVVALAFAIRLWCTHRQAEEPLACRA